METSAAGCTNNDAPRLFDRSNVILLVLVSTCLFLILVHYTIMISRTTRKMSEQIKNVLLKDWCCCFPIKCFCFVLLLSSLDFTLDGKRLYIILQNDIDSEIRIVSYRTLKFLYRLRGLFNVNLLPLITENYYCMKYSLSVSNYHHLLSQIIRRPSIVEIYYYTEYFVHIITHYDF